MTRTLEAEFKAILEGSLPDNKAFRKAQPEDRIIGVGSLEVGLDRYVQKGWIIGTPRMTVNAMGPSDVDTTVAILDTGAEANVMPLSMAKGLGCPILSTEHLKLRTVSGQVMRFSGMAKVSIEVEHGVGCDTVFFLIDKSTIVLLGQPFIKAMKLTFEYPEDGSIEAVMVSPKSKGSTCTVMVVPPVKLGYRAAKQAFAEEESDDEAEN